MIHFFDRISSLFYRILRIEIPNYFGACKTCNKYKKNWDIFIFKENHLIGFDNILAEWVFFSDFNIYAKVWIINGYITNIHILDKDLWNRIKSLCRKCISKILQN